MNREECILEKLSSDFGLICDEELPRSSPESEAEISPIANSEHSTGADQTTSTKGNAIIKKHLFTCTVDLGSFSNKIVAKVAEVVHIKKEASVKLCDEPASPVKMDCDNDKSVLISETLLTNSIKCETDGVKQIVEIVSSKDVGKVEATDDNASDDTASSNAEETQENCDEMEVFMDIANSTCTRQSSRCSFCRKVLLSGTSFENHVKTHSCLNPFPCPICGRSFTVKSAVKQHMARHKYEKRKRYTCHLCSRSFIYTVPYEKHMRYHKYEKPFPCTLCKKKFIRQSKLDKHMLSHARRSRNATSKNKMSPCGICGELFTRKAAFMKHINMHKKKKSSQQSIVPDFSISLEGMDEDSMGTGISGLKSYQCEMCGTTFGEKNEFENHVQTHIINKMGGINMNIFPCEVCGRTYTRERSLQVHAKVHFEKESPDSSDADSGKPEKENTADGMSRTHEVQNKTDFDLHHCEICGLAFSRVVCLENHMKFHERQKIDAPRKDTPTKSNMKGYIRTHNLGLDIFKCKLCPAMFGKKRNVKKHVKRHMKTHGKKSSGFYSGTDTTKEDARNKLKCDTCGKGFSESKNLELHTILHDKRSYYCEICGRIIVHASNMLSHVRAHTRQSNSCNKTGATVSKITIEENEMQQ